MSRRPLLLLPMLTLLTAADWPQWLGPDRNGASTESGVADAWAQGLTEAWRRAPGTGYSGISVADGVVYTMADEGEGQFLVALDATTGADRWRARVDDAYHDKMGFDGPRSTPTIAGTLAVALTARGKVVTVSTLDGSVKWTVDLVKTYGSKMPTWGFSGSPLVDDGTVYLDAGGTNSRGLLALDLSTGAETWTSGTYVAGYSAPVRMTLDGTDQVIFFTGKAVVGARPSDGAVLWYEPWNTSYDVNAATPQKLGDSRVFIASGYGTGGAAIDLSDGATTSKVAWKTKRMKNKMATSVLHEGTIYGFSEDQLTALSATDGSELWSQGGFGRGTLMLADGHLVVLGETCELALVKASPSSFQQVGERTKLLSNEPCWTVPSLADGVLYLRDPKNIVAVKLGGPVSATP